MLTAKVLESVAKDDEPEDWTVVLLSELMLRLRVLERTTDDEPEDAMILLRELMLTLWLLALWLLTVRVLEGISEDKDPDEDVTVLL